MLPKNRESQLYAQLKALSITDPNFPTAAHALRETIDAAYEQGTVTLHEWRVLIEQLSVVQAKFVALQPGGWRRASPSVVCSDRQVEVPGNDALRPR